MNNSLNEAYASSMPEPIRKLLLTKRFKASMISRTGDKHIALDKANFIKYPNPTSNRDPIFKDNTKLRFYILDDGNIYVPSINDDDSYIFHYNQWLPNKYLPVKVIMEHLKEIYYVDLNDENNLTSEKVNTRIQNRPTDERVRDYNKLPWATKRKINSKELKLDKSGYLIDPNRLVNKMTELGLYNPAKRAKKFYDSLVATKSDLMNALDEIDIDQSGKSDSASLIYSIREAMSSFSQGISNYNYMMKNLETFSTTKEHGTLSNQDYAKACSSTIEDYGERISYCTKRVGEYIDKFIGYAVDWDTEDEQ